MGSRSDLKHAQAAATALSSLGIASEIRVGSAHKTPVRLLALLEQYEADPRPKVYITIAGRSNALSGMVDAQVSAPVIACPPLSESGGGGDIYSSLRMPSGGAPAGILDPEGAALFAAKILALADPTICQRITALQKQKAERVIADDALRNTQPYLIETIYGPLGLSHNGNLINAAELRHRLLERGVGLSSSTDSEVITQMLAAPPEVWSDNKLHLDGNGLDRWEGRIRAFMEVAEGAYSLTILTRDAVYAVRDPLGLRPLCLGQFDSGGYVVASESCAIVTIGAHYIREIEL